MDGQTTKELKKLNSNDSDKWTDKYHLLIYYRIGFGETFRWEVYRSSESRREIEKEYDRLLSNTRVDPSYVKIVHEI